MTEEYRLVLVSYVGERDGMAIELKDNSGEQVAEVYEDDESGERTVRFFTSRPVPLIEVRRLIKEAEESL